jgi:pyruvate/2-oxoglutarate dehydrogenase complex dihydrolipoamide acyltransferase (E2) component
MGDAAGELVMSRWFKTAGERVAKGEPLFEVATDKAEVEALDTGVLSRILLAEGQSAEPGETIAYIDADAG